PFYLKIKGPEEGVYVRLGSTNRVAGPELLSEMRRAFTTTSFDQTACPDCKVESLDWKRIEETFSGEVTLNKLETLGVVVPYSGKLVCSNGGIILFGKDAVREKYFPNAKVRCARFQGTDKVYFIDQLDTEGSLIDSLKEVSHFIRRNTRLGAKIEQIQ